MKEEKTDITKFKRNIIIIPAYEPDEKMILLLKEIKEKMNIDIIVVDDGSSSACRPVFEKAQKYAVLLKHSTNMGKGRAIKTALAYIQEHLEQMNQKIYLVTADADGQHKAKDIMAVCQALREDASCDMVLGSRRFEGDVPRKSRYGNEITKQVFYAVTGDFISDTQTGLRAFRSSLIPFLLAVDGDRYEYEMNVLLYASKKHIPMKEIWIETIYFNKNQSTHFHPLRDSMRIYHQIMKFAGSSFLCFLIDYGLFNLLHLTTLPLLGCNIFARCVSATINYTMNKRFVFSCKEGQEKPHPFLSYALLAVVILVINSVILEIMTSLHVKAAIAKLFTEMLLFISSFLIQKYFIFTKKGRM